MTDYRILIGVGASIALHAAVLLWGSPYTGSDIRLSRGDHAIEMDLITRPEAIARTSAEPTQPITEIKQEIRQRVEDLADRLATAVQVLGEIELPKLPEPVEPPKPVIEPILRHAREQIDRSADETAECVRAVAEAMQRARQKAAAEAGRQRMLELARRAAAEAEQRRLEEIRRQRLAELAKATPPKPPVDPTRDDGNAETNAEAKTAGQGEQGVTSVARYAGGGRPTYPSRCRRLGQEGSVVLEIQVLAGGKCGWARVIKSSGIKALDDAALRFAKKQATFEPAMRGGKPVDSVICLPYRFKLKDS
jgi:TonB family protein